MLTTQEKAIFPNAIVQDKNAKTFALTKVTKVDKWLKLSENF